MLAYQCLYLLVIINFNSWFQVPSEGVRWRLVHLLCRHDVLRGGGAGLLLQDAAAVPHPANPQLPVQSAAALQTHPMSEASAAQVRIKECILKE